MIHIYIYLEKHWSFIECSCTYHDTRALALAALKKVLSRYFQRTMMRADGRRMV